MELDLDALAAAGGADVRRRPSRTFPPALIDVALVVDARCRRPRCEAALRDGAGELLESLRLFDVFTGEQVGGAGSRWRTRCASAPPDRTLTAEEVLGRPRRRGRRRRPAHGAVLRGA